MKSNIQIVNIFILVGLIGSCKTNRFANEDFSYKEEILHSILVPTLKSFEGKFVFGEFDSIQYKATKVDYDKAIESIINSIDDGLYKDTYQEMHNIISNEFVKSDSVNLNTIRTTKLIMYPIYDLVKLRKLFVYDKRIEQVQDSIWAKSYYGERLYQDSLRVRFYEGKLYVTKTGREFLRVGLRSGQ